MYVKSGPLTPDQFDAFMAPLGPFLPGFHMAVGVSGGPDSLALALLAHEWSQRHGGRITALTVDHGLRAEAAQEAAQVGAWLTARGISHHTLPWEGPKPIQDLQAKARTARYDLLQQWCLRAGASHVAVAHHARDQCETFLMRLSHKSGLQGLCGMESRVPLSGGVQLIRPLLTVHPDDLTATLKARGQAFIQDPSNTDVRFERAQWRERIMALPEAFPETLLSLQQLISLGWNRFVAGTLTGAPIHVGCGYASCASTWFFEQSQAGQELVLNRLLATVGARPYPPSPGSVKALREALGSGRKVATLHGCVVCVSHKHLWVGRELRAAAQDLALEGKKPYRWDDRFDLQHSLSETLHVGPLGAQDTPRFRPLKPNMPACIWWGLPTVRRGPEVVGIADLLVDPQVQVVFRSGYIVV
jgi:tRNA(Ile)-lysidine synthase